MNEYLLTYDQLSNLTHLIAAEVAAAYPRFSTLEQENKAWDAAVSSLPDVLRDFLLYNAREVITHDGK